VLVMGDRSCLSDRQRRWLDANKDAVAALHVTGRLSTQRYWAVATWGAIARKYRPSWESEECV
jgi:hypothetical protein